MIYTITKSQADALGFDLTKAVKDFIAAKAAHAKTVNRPAPTAHPIVEDIVRDGGKFTVLDDTPVLTAADLKAGLLSSIQSEMIDRLNAIVSPARRQLAQMDLAALGSKTDRTPEEELRVQEIQALFQRLSLIQRRALLLQVEVEDLLEAQIPGWAPHGWPA